jgi:transposase
LGKVKADGIEPASQADEAESNADWTLSDPSLGKIQQPRLPAGRRRGRRLVRREASPRVPFTPEQRLLILDSWQRSGLPAGDFAPLVGLSKHTLYAWKKQFDEQGPGGLVDRPRGARTGSRLPEVTKRSILLLKQSHPDWGCQRISDMLLRGPALPASASAVARVLHEAGYELEEVATRPHPDKPRRFERRQEKGTAKGQQKVSGTILTKWRSFDKQSSWDGRIELRKGVMSIMCSIGPMRG